MARNEEKAMTMLNRWYNQKRELGKKDIVRPKGFNRIHNIDSLTTCEKWRNSIIREVSKLVSQIQNAGLGEYRIRELNDEINQLLKEKKQWEDRIIELGGSDHRKLGIEDVQGSELPGFGGYKYFGAAKDLPGVRELFQKEAPKAPKKQGLLNVYKTLDFNVYFGDKIENEQEILNDEQRVEQSEREELYQEWVKNNQHIIKKMLHGKKQEDREEIMKLIDQQAWNEEEDNIEIEENQIQQQQQEQKSAADYILEEKKRALLKQYAQIEEEQEDEDK